ncbi:hypothetical protein FO519_008154 [Halicephalobus sp. NKZ332]|nr:hypothetical protein FO519_008154 [Halicephalobus sp. NKZ332]
MKYLIIFLFLLLPSIEGLKCYQGVLNSTLDVPGVATDCSTTALTCTKEFLNDTLMVRRACSDSNCTINGTPSGSLCVPVGNRINCCCYVDCLQCYSTPGNLSATDPGVKGTPQNCSLDAKTCFQRIEYAASSDNPVVISRGCSPDYCEDKMQPNILSISIFLTLFGIAQGIRCYESQLPVNVSVTGSANECAYGMQSCLKTVTFGQATRSCQAVPCNLTFPGQRNMTCAIDTSGNTQCCCSTDGCNSAPSTLTSFFVLGLAGFGYWNIL